MSVIAEMGSEYAESWHDDALLTNIDIEFAPSTSASRLFAFTSFASGSGGEAWYVVHIEVDKNGEYLVLDSSGDFYEDPRERAEALEIAALNLSTAEAIKIGLAAAEEEIPARILKDITWPASVEVRHMDEYEKSGPPEWSVSLIHESGRGGFHVTIDDTNGEIIEIRNFME